MWVPEFADAWKLVLRQQILVGCVVFHVGAVHTNNLNPIQIAAIQGWRQLLHLLKARVDRDEG